MASSSTTSILAKSNAPAPGENSGALIKPSPPDPLLVIFIHGCVTPFASTEIRGLTAVVYSRCICIYDRQVQGNGFDVQFVPKAAATCIIEVDRQCGRRVHSLSGVRRKPPFMHAFLPLGVDGLVVGTIDKRRTGSSPLTRSNADDPS